MKKINCLLLAVAIAASLSACGEETCADCEKIEALQAELKEITEYINENREYEGTQEFDEKEERYYSIYKQLELLMEHECTIPVVEVKDKEYIMGGLIGTYTGEWKSSSPCGHGVYTAKSNVKNEDAVRHYVYDCEWSGGYPNGYGTETCEGNKLDSTDTYYKGYFVDGKYNGEGYYYFKAPGFHFDLTGTFTDGFMYGNGTRREYNSNGNIYFIVTVTFEGNVLAGRGDFKQYDDNGELIDYGVCEGPDYTKIDSVMLNKAKKQTSDALWGLFSGLLS